MGQDFHVVRCSTCQSFQVQQVKRVNRWSCKLCGEKQSLLKEFGRGSGADCRRHVQKLNALRGAVMEEQDTWSLWKQVETDGRDVPEQHKQVERTGLSRWSKYMDTPEEAEPEEVEELMDRQPLHGNNMIDSEDHPSEDHTSPPSEDHPSEDHPSEDHTSPPSEDHPSEDHTSPLSEDHPSEDHTSPLSEDHPSEDHTSPPSEDHPSEDHTSPLSEDHPSEDHPSEDHPSEDHPSEDHPSPPRKKSIRLPSLGSGPVSRWACFLQTDRQEQGEEPAVSRRSQTVGGATSLSCNDIISQASFLPSMFDSGEDFSLDF